MVESTHEIIPKYFPKILVDKIKWERLYPSSFGCYDYCQFKFLLRYHTDIKTPINEIMSVGLRCHDMKDKFYKKVNYDKMITICEKYKGDRVKLANYIILYFRNVKMSQLEQTAMFGFALFEANRIVSIIEMFDKKYTILKYLNPVASELKIRTENFGGKIDTLFRDPTNDGYLVNDWKDGTSKPSKAPKSYRNQVNIYAILFDEEAYLDNWGMFPVRVIPDGWTVTLPRYSETFFGNFTTQGKKYMRMVVISALENINAHQFKMRCDSYHCKWNWNWQCEFFHPVCKAIMENEFGMIFEDTEFKYSEDGIWFDF